jgi:acyl dehydratase
MARFDAQAALPGGAPGPWSEPVEIRYDRRDVLLYAVGIGIDDLRYVYEGHPQFAVFPTFAIRWGQAGLKLPAEQVPSSPGPLTIDAERAIEQLHPLPVAGVARVRSRLRAVHPRGKGAAFVEAESVVSDEQGRDCLRLVNGSFRRGVAALGDIEPFEGSGQSFFSKLEPPERPADVELHTRIGAQQAHIYRLSGDYNPLHIDPAAARTGGFDAPILHGLCTYGHCAQLLLQALAGGDAARFGALKLRFASPVLPGDTLDLRAWHDGPGRVVFEGRVGDRVVVSNAWFTWR